MPRRGRHRVSLPKRLLAIVAALLITGGVVTIAGSAFADPEGDSGPDSGFLSSLAGDDSEGGSEDEQSEEGADDGSGSRPGSEDDSTDGSQDDPAVRGEDDEGQGEGEGEGQGQGQEDEGGQAAAAADPNPGRDEIAPAGPEDYVSIADVPENGNIGEGGEFSGGSYTVDCGVSDHNNSDNYMAAPGKPNGAQHVHDYVGNTTTDANSDDESLESGGTSCTNGERSAFFWPVLRDLNGTGPDVGEDGGSLDGNVGSLMRPESADLTFHGHGDEPVEPMPVHLMMIMGNAKAGAQDGANANAKYTCSNTNRFSELYPICEEGQQLQRVLDYPSCWDGENLEPKDLRSHLSYPDDQGNCAEDQTPIPALRITLTYDQPGGRAFSIDSFPNEQHAPGTDHSDYHNFASEAQNEAGAECINTDQRCPASGS